MRLLLAEDEEDLSKALVAVLKHNNYSVDAVYNGQDALDYLETENYDGAILDIMMPKMDGLTVLRKIREDGNSVPVILLTAAPMYCPAAVRRSGLPARNTRCLRC